MEEAQLDRSDSLFDMLGALQGAAASLAATLVPSLLGGLLLVLLPVVLAALAMRRRAKQRAEQRALTGDSSAKGDVGGVAATKALPQDALPVLLGLWAAPKPVAVDDAELGGEGYRLAPRQASSTCDDSVKRSDPSSHALKFGEASSQVGTVPGQWHLHLLWKWQQAQAPAAWNKMPAKQIAIWLHTSRGCTEMLHRKGAS